MAISRDRLELYRGRWREILPTFGVASSFLQNKHGPCPMCGGKDRFRFDDKNGEGTYFCNSCGAGNGFHLIQHTTGMSFRETVMAVDKIVGAPPAKFERDSEADRQRAAMIRLWRSSEPIVAGSPPALYLARRGLGELALKKHGLRWCSAVRHPASPALHCAMVAQIAGADHKCVNIHITYLNTDGTKVNIEPAKRVMAGRLPEGAAIRLGRPQRVMGIAEGIETALSARILHKMPVWAAVNGALLAKWVPPAEAEEIWIFGDNDINFAGQAKAYGLAHRLAARKSKGKVRIVFPEKPDTDWNDVLLSR